MQTTLCFNERWETEGKRFRKAKDNTIGSPALGKHTLKDGASLLVLNGHNELIGLDYIVLVDARTHLEATELACIAPANGSTTNPADGNSVDLLAILHVVVVHVHPATFTRHFPVVGRISVAIERKSQSKGMKNLILVANVFPNPQSPFPFPFPLLSHRIASPLA